MNTTAILYSSLYNESYAFLMERALTGKATLGFATIALTIDLLIIYTIWRTKDLHNKSHLLILSISMSHAIYALQTVIFAGRLLIRIRDATPLIVPSWLCTINSQLQLLPISAFAVLGTILAIDRFMCVMTPIFYHQIETKRYVLIVNVTAYTYAVLVVLLSMIGTDIYSLFDCEVAGRFNFNTFGTTYASVASYVQIGAKAVLYASAACSLMIRYKRAKLSGSVQRIEWRRRWEIRVFAAMCANGAISIFMRLVTSLPYFIGSQQTDVRLGVALKLVATLAVCIEGMTHLAIYLIIDNSFRSGFRKAILDKLHRGNAVSQIGGTNGRG